MPKQTQHRIYSRATKTVQSYKMELRAMLMLVKCILLFILYSTHAHRILVVYPTGTSSHRAVLIPFVQELLRRQHEVTVVTVWPSAFQTTANLTEIVLDFQYEFEQEETDKAEAEYKDAPGIYDNYIHDLVVTLRRFGPYLGKAVEMQEIKELMDKGDDYFDLIVLESWIRPSLALAHAFKAPVILINSAGNTVLEGEAISAPSHPTLYMTQYQQRVYNLTLWEKLGKFYKYWRWQYEWRKLDRYFDEIIRDKMGEGVPPLRELACRVQKLIVNEHHIWAGNRPEPPNLVRVWGIHLQPTKPLPEELQTYLDASEAGVIYMSFGTSLSKKKKKLLQPLTELIVNVLSQLSYDVLLKWDNELPGVSKNIRIGKWFPQADLLKHPKVKLFITQGGLQSTDEAIEAGVPLLGLPLNADQWYQTEHYARFGIGEQLLTTDVTEEKVAQAVQRIIGDPSYRHNIASLRTLLHDEPAPTGAARAAWHAEHVIRHVQHKTCLSWARYLEADLVLVVLMLFSGVWGSWRVWKWCRRWCKNAKQIKVKRK